MNSECIFIARLFVKLNWVMQHSIEPQPSKSQNGD
jgi:hypothetical protein